jgi:hypothetical protein
MHGLFKLVVGTGAALLVLVASTAVTQGAPVEQVTPPPASTPAAAVAAAVLAMQAVYAGTCVTTGSPADIGKVCSTFVAQRGSQQAYLVGRTFSEFNAWVFVLQAADGWRTLGTAPFDATAAPANIPWPAR